MIYSVTIRLRHKRGTIASLVLALVLSCGCINHANSDNTLPERYIIALYGVNGLGDRGYNDGICRGIEKAAAQHRCDTWHLTPGDMDEGRMLLQLLVEEFSEFGDRNCLIVTADVGYVTPESLKLIERSTGCRILILESRESHAGACTVNMPLYGASWMAGRMAASMDGVSKAGIICARPEYPQLQDAVKGFICGAKGIDAAMAEIDFAGSDPFDSADLLYRLSPELKKEYQMIFPLCGGSTQGLLSYCRENPEASFYTIGIDSDLSRYCERVPFSIIKNMEDVLFQCVGRWLSKEGLPAHIEYGMSSGNVEVVVSGSYKTMFPEELIGKLTEEAIEKEKEYESAM
ncbi:MAG: BMP family ABC transporter substrate-binding protein [Bacteroidales bacterium]|nr:BMP family ABC transporter substrate-binding protein [Bacteroidales bacterium]